MKTIKFIAILFIVNLVFTKRLMAQQNIQFSQYIFNSLSVNPAYAGYKEEWFAQMALRAQWVGMDGAPRTATASIDGVIDPLNKKNGIGFQITADKVGPQLTNSATLNYAYRLPLNMDETQRLSIGVGVGVSQYSLNGNILTTVDLDDEAVAASSQSKISPGLRLGIYYSSDSFYAGLSMMDILSDSPKNISNSLNIVHARHAYFIIGNVLNMTSQVKLRSSLLIKDDFRGPTSADLNIMGIISDKVWLGGSIRSGFNIWNKQEVKLSTSKQNSISGIVQFYATQKLRIGYSYDYITSKLGSNQIGTQEISLGFTFGEVSKAYICAKVF